MRYRYLDAKTGGDWERAAVVCEQAGRVRRFMLGRLLTLAKPLELLSEDDFPGSWNREDLRLGPILEGADLSEEDPISGMLDLILGRSREPADAHHVP